MGVASVWPLSYTMLRVVDGDVEDEVQVHSSSFAEFSPPLLEIHHPRLISLSFSIASLA